MVKHATPEHETAAAKITILTQVLKQQQKVMDLKSGKEDATIDVVMTKYIAPEYDAKKFEPLSESEFEESLFEAARSLIEPVADQIQAFLIKATSDSYQAGKAAALAGGDYVTSDLKAKIVQVMRGNQNFTDISAKDCFERWKAGYLAKKPGATKVLDTAKALGDFGNDL